MVKPGHTPIPRYRRQSGPAILDQGFRPFFLFAALYAAIAMSGWLHMLLAGGLPPTLFGPIGWHAHEMLYGFVMAVVAGFLLTAIPNWTGRMPLQGLPLAGLVCLWLAGRVAVSFSAYIGALPAALVDLAFPLVFVAIVLREIVSGRNWRNLPMVAALLALTLGNALMHLEAAGWTSLSGRFGGAGARLGLGVMVMLISLIGGRIVPSFTRNWLVKRGSAALPAGFGTVDRLALGATGLAALVFVLAPASAMLAVLAALAALLQLVRLSRWQGWRTGAEPLVLVLHAAYLWLPLGFALLAGSVVWPALLPSAAAIHAFAAGAIGTMTVAVMTRATLGHTGRALMADRATCLIYAALFIAAFSRIAASLWPAFMLRFFEVSGVFWTAAFLGFAIVYGRYLIRPRPRTSS